MERFPDGHSIYRKEDKIGEEQSFRVKQGFCFGHIKFEMAFLPPGRDIKRATGMCLELRGEEFGSYQHKCRVKTLILREIMCAEVNKGSSLYEIM